MKPEDIIRISKRIAQTMYASYFEKIREACAAHSGAQKEPGKDIARVLEEEFQNALVKAVAESLNSES